MNKYLVKIAQQAEEQPKEAPGFYGTLGHHTAMGAGIGASAGGAYGTWLGHKLDKGAYGDVSKQVSKETMRLIQDVGPRRLVGTALGFGGLVGGAGLGLAAGAIHGGIRAHRNKEQG